MSKEQVITIAHSMGFVLDYDQWDVEGKAWLRFHFKGYTVPNMCLIWGKGDPLESVLKQSANILYRAGQEIKIKQINGVVNL